MGTPYRRFDKGRFVTKQDWDALVYEKEILRLEFQIRLDGMRSPAERNRMGQFATPNRLAKDIATYCVGLLDEAEQIRLLEPAVGSGSFFSALLQTVAQNRIAEAVGFETDDRFSELSQRLWGEMGLEVIAGDFTKHYSKVSGANLVLANPPYVRHHHLDLGIKTRLQREAAATAGLVVGGLSGLYVYFMAIAHAAMADQAVAAWLLPTEFMDVNYGSALREYLSGQVEMIRLHRFDPENTQFEDALVSSSVVVFRNSPPGRHAETLFTFGGSLLKPDRSEVVKIKDLSRHHKWTFTRSTASIKRPSKSVAIGDLFHIRRGLVTGANSFL